jgi:LPS O-antigen subunit length determinant protein (WzzB/FepE family)
MPEPKKHGYSSLIILTLVIIFFLIGGGAAFLIHRAYSARQLITSTKSQLKSIVGLQPSLVLVLVLVLKRNQLSWL